MRCNNMFKHKHGEIFLHRQNNLCSKLNDPDEDIMIRKLKDE